MAVGEREDALESHQRQWRHAFLDYAVRHPEQSDVAAQFIDFVIAHANAARRELSIGHLTGSAWVVSGDGRRVLLMHHRKLNRWLQPGGHADGDVNLAQVALREAREETGLRDLVIEGGIFDLDRHRIPARGDEAEHWHYDVRFVVRALGSEDFVINEESHALAWRDVADVAGDLSLGESVRRMARDWLMLRESAR
jgi:8-oxo-dGTP pyrophosphatase MutT (NUDIX family)